MLKRVDTFRELERPHFIVRLLSPLGSYPSEGFRTDFEAMVTTSDLCFTVTSVSKDEFVVSVKTGMRLSEQYSCRWLQVHLDRRTIELTKTKNGSDRTVHLNADAIAAIKSLRGPNQKLVDPVFPREGSRFDTRSWFVPCLKEAKIAGFLWHCNRHTFCSWLAMSGASTKDIQEAAGHKTITMAGRYSHLSPAHNRSVVDLIGRSGYSGENESCVEK